MKSHTPEPRSAERPNTAIWEPDPAGHRMVYVALIVKECHRLGINAHVISSTSAKNDNQIDIHVGVREIFTFAGDTLRGALSCAADISADHVIVPSADDKLLAIMRTFPLPKMTLLIMDNPFTSTKRPGVVSGIRRNAKRLVLRALEKRSGIRVLYLAPSSPLSEVRPQEVPDPVILPPDYNLMSVNRSQLLRDRSAADIERRWVGLVGGIGHHKNPLLVARAVRLLAESGVPLGFRVLGPVKEPLLTELQRELRALETAGVAVEVDYRRRSNTDICKAIASLDVLVCAYSTDAPNSTTAKAYYLGTKIVGAGSEVFLRNGARFWTETASELGVLEIGNALRRALEKPSVDAADAPPASDFGQRILGVS